MPQASKTEHHLIENTALPYISNSSVTSTSPQFIPGSTNVLTSLREWSERRPGFSAIFERIATQFPNLQRSFIWQRWPGSATNPSDFIWMGCDISGQTTVPPLHHLSFVYTMNLRTDASAQLLFTSQSPEAFDFVISNNTCYFGNGTDMQQWDGNRLATWGGASPVAGPGISLIAGANNVYTSWCYCATYFDSYSDHETSPSPISACSGVFTNKTVQLALTASTNPRFDGIRVYRTPDGGAQDPTEMQEITGSPFPNVTATVSDSTLDINLSTRVAPAFFRNDPPTPSMGAISYAGRIWTFANNIVYYSGFEEISNGVPEESFPSGLDGNNYPYANVVTALAPLVDGIAVLTPEKIGKIEGDSLDTFRRYTLLEKRGTRSRTTVCALGGSVVWLDTSNTIWLSDMGEIGIPIRPDIKNINPLTCWITIHISGLSHWVVVLDGSNGILYIYDLDRQIWMPPWNIGTTASALFSGETSVGVIDLILARNTSKILKLVQGTYNDDGNTYSAIATTNQFKLTPDNNLAWKGILDWTEIKTDTVPPTQVLQLTDDNPDLATFTDITANKEASPDIVQGQFLQTWRYTSGEASGVTTPECQFISLKYVYAAAESNFHLYTIDVAGHPAGG